MGVVIVATILLCCQNVASASRKDTVCYMFDICCVYNQYKLTHVLVCIYHT
jgi:hypothetical protein